MGSNDAANFFDKFAVTFDTFYEGKRNLLMQMIDKKFRSDMYVRFKMTSEYLNELNGKTVVDIGCGSGIYMLQALNQGAEFVTGLDPADGMLKLTEERLNKSNYQGKFDLKNGLFPETSVEPHDYAIVMGVMDYVENASAFLEELRRVGRKSAAVSFPSYHWLRGPIRKTRYNIRNCPLFFYNENVIYDLGKKAGFKYTKVTKIPGAGMDYFVVFSNE